MEQFNYNEFPAEVLKTIESTVYDIAVRVGNANEGFCGDANSTLVAPNVYQLWEGAAHIVNTPDHILCVYYGEESYVTFYQYDLAGIADWIQHVDNRLSNQIEE